MPREDHAAVTTASTLAGFGLLRDEWDELVRAMPRPSPFLLHGWLDAWCRHHLSDGELRVHVARRDGRLVGAVPLFVQRRRGLRVAQFVGGSQSALADMLLAADAGPDVADSLIERCLRSGHDWADLFGLPTQSRLGSLAGGSRLHLLERVEAPVLDLSDGFDAVYREKTSSKRRNLHKRRLRQLSEMGRLEITVARSADELAKAIEAAFFLHRLRWAGRPDGSGFGTPTGMRFHRDAIRALAQDDIPRIITLSVDGRPVAFHYWFAFCNRMYVHRLAFDPAFSRCSPGLVATLEAIKEAAAEGATLVEYLGGDERYKMELADRTEPLHQGIGMAATPAGRVAVALRLGGLELRKRLKRSSGLRRLYYEGLAPARRLLAGGRGR